jgi:hypothetical protein
MSARGMWLSAAVLVVLGAGSVRAQRPDSTAPRADTAGTLSCARGAVLRLSAGTTADSAGRAPAATSGANALAGRGAIDTVITLNIADRSWQRDNVSAGVALGVGGSAGARRAAWHACAGATATFGRITATLHNVHGQIHLKADPGALDAIGATTGRTTPPAPPRR